MSFEVKLVIAKAKQNLTQTVSTILYTMNNMIFFLLILIIKQCCTLLKKSAVISAHVFSSCSPIRTNEQFFKNTSLKNVFPKIVVFRKRK